MATRLDKCFRSNKVRFVLNPFRGARLFTVIGRRQRRWQEAREFWVPMSFPNIVEQDGMGCCSYSRRINLRPGKICCCGVNVADTNGCQTILSQYGFRVAKKDLFEPQSSSRNYEMNLSPFVAYSRLIFFQYMGIPVHSCSATKYIVFENPAVFCIFWVYQS